MTIYNESVLDALIQTDTVTKIRGATGLASDSVTLTEVIGDMYSINPIVEDLLAMSDGITTHLTAVGLSEDQIIALDIVYAPIFVIINEVFTASDVTDFDPAFYVAVADSMVLQDLAPTRIIALGLLSDAFLLLDEVNRFLGATVSESITLIENYIANAKVHHSVIDELIASVTVSNTMSSFVILSEDIVIDETWSLQQVLSAHIEELLFLGGTLNIGDDNYTFVLNTENTASSVYTNYNFNSIYGDLAANSTGIYELSGDTDDGTNIAARLKTGLMDFGESLHKQVPYAYIGLNNSGSIILKTITQQHGVKKERMYRVTQSRDATDSLKVKMGKGVKSRYWQFEIVNNDGANFNIDDFEILPLVLKRRV